MGPIAVLPGGGFAVREGSSPMGRPVCGTHVKSSGVNGSTGGGGLKGMGGWANLKFLCGSWGDCGREVV